MSSTSNNGFIAAIVEQTGGGKSPLLSNDAPTIVEKYQTPMKKADRMEEYKDGEDSEMSDFAPIESVDLPTIWLNTKQLPSAKGLVVGDKVYLKVEAEVANYSFNENVEGEKREEYTFKLKKGCVKKDD